MFKVGDIVARFSHQQDIFFHVDQIHENSEGGSSAILKGLNLRLLADAPLSDLIAKRPVEVANYERE
ncbi:MAG TPA: sporulation peptidase YabG, partial [Desulfosporosinus sp.]|nr:sporulation peptidase YabG [Desulfosporosinus sp.]